MNNITGLSAKSNQEIAEKLNDLLANYEVYYQNLRGFHWNIKGNDFFTLHEKFEELYNAAQLSIDEVAERILTLGAQPLHTYSDFIQVSAIQEAKNLSDSKSTVEALLNGLKVLIEKERAILSLASETDDEGTLALMSEYLATQEKTVWMFTAFLNN